MPLGGEFQSVLDAAKAGGEWAWKILFHEFAGPVSGYLALRGAADPDNLAGEVFLQLARNLKRFSGEEKSFRSWVFMIAHHRLIDERRARSRRPVEALSDRARDIKALDDVEAEAIARVTDPGLREALESLTPDQRDVIALRIIGELTLEETAQAIGKKVKAVVALQRRGLNALRREMTARGVAKPTGRSVTTR